MKNRLESVVLKNKAGSEVTLLNWGASLQSFKVQMSNGEQREIMLGCEDTDRFLQNSGYLGATVGRYANRINNAKVSFQGKDYQLTANQDQHQLHGANDLSHRYWEVVSQDAQQVCFGIHSADGEKGFPGNFDAKVTYHLAEDNQLTISYDAQVDQTCPVNLTNHSYFNLDANPSDIMQHQLWLDAAEYLPVAADGIPVDGLKAVADTGFDFNQAKTIAQDFLKDADQQPVSGYDHSYLLNPKTVADSAVIARLFASDGSLALAVSTSKPAIQLYTGNFLVGNPAWDGKVYQDHAGLALETQFLPDSPNRPDWPHQSCWLAPGERYQYQTVYHPYQP